MPAESALRGEFRKSLAHAAVQISTSDFVFFDTPENFKKTPLRPLKPPPFHGCEGRIAWSVGGQWQAVWLTRSREAAKGKRMEGGEVCAELPAFSFQLSRIYSLWHGCHGPLTPDSSPPFHGGEGRILCFLSCGKRNSTPRPWKGRGDGGEG